MRYQCMSCDARFEHEGEDLRCPQCMRRHGIVPEGAASAAKRGRLIALGLAALALLAGGGYALYRLRTPDVVAGEAPRAPLSERELRAYLGAHGYPPDAQGVAQAVQAWGDLLVPGDAVKAFADEHGEAGSAAKQAEGLVAALRARAESGAFVPWPRMDARDRAPLKPEAVLEAIAEDQARAELYPFEVAALAVSALRARDVPALVAEAHAFPDARRPADPSARLGYYVVAVPGKDGAMAYLDPFGGHAEPPSDQDVTVLTDVQAVAAALALDALHLSRASTDSGAALDRAQAAVKLAPRSPSVRGARAMVALAGGGLDEGMRELEAALQLRSDAPRKLQVASLHLSQGDVDKAARLVAQALEQFPEYAAAHASLAGVHLARRERDLAKNALDSAERLEPDLPILPSLWAGFYLEQGDTERAMVRAEQAVERRPHDPQSRLLLARIYRQVGRYDDMRRQARALLAGVPASQRTGLEGTIKQLLGPTALDEPLDLDSAPASDTPAGEALGLPDPSAASLSLGDDSLLLGEQGSAAPGEPASAAAQGREAGDQPLLQLGDPSKLKLRDDDKRLQLDLQP